MLKDELKKYRLKNCLSLQDMADKLGVTFMTYWRWENGYPCSYENARKISETLGIKKEKIYAK